MERKLDFLMVVCIVARIAFVVLGLATILIISKSGADWWIKAVEIEGIAVLLFIFSIIRFGKICPRMKEEDEALEFDKETH